MTTRVELMRTLKELPITSVLSQKKNWILLCDEPFHGYFVGNNFPRDHLRLLSEFPSKNEEIPANFVYVICTNADEAPHSSVIKKRGGQAIGLFSNIIPRLIALAPPRFNWPDATAPTTSYAMISLPRAASTVLAQELKSLGVGLPTEHIRDPIIEFAAHRAITNFDLFSWWKILTLSQTANNIFGTKIIWDFLEMFRVRLVSAEYDWLLEQLSKFHFFYLVRDDKVGQAVSDYVARATGIWHKWSKKKEAQYEDKLKEISGTSSVNMNDLVATYNKFVASEEKLRKFLESLGAPVTEITFDQICDNPRLEAAKIGRSLGVKIGKDAEKGQPALERTTSEQHLRIEAELRAHLSKASHNSSPDHDRRIISKSKR